MTIWDDKLNFTILLTADSHEDSNRDCLYRCFSKYHQTQALESHCAYLDIEGKVNIVSTMHQYNGAPSSRVIASMLEIDEETEELLYSIARRTFDYSSHILD